MHHDITINLATEIIHQKPNSDGYNAVIGKKHANRHAIHSWIRKASPSSTNDVLVVKFSIP